MTTYQPSDANEAVALIDSYYDGMRAGVRRFSQHGEAEIEKIMKLLEDQRKIAIKIARREPWL